MVGDAHDLRKAFGSYATGVTIITTRVAGQLYGLTANSFTSVSLLPPILLFCIGQSRNSFDAFRRSESFTINVLSSTQRELGERFASSGEEKWHGVEFMEDAFGNAVFPEAAAIFSCSKLDMIDAGRSQDHSWPGYEFPPKCRVVAASVLSQPFLSPCRYDIMRSCLARILPASLFLEVSNLEW